MTAALVSVARSRKNCCHHRTPVRLATSATARTTDTVSATRGLRASIGARVPSQAQAMSRTNGAAV